ncbi:MAG: gamma-glutamyltransferase family protein [Bacillota bacterium]
MSELRDSFADSRAGTHTVHPLVMGTSGVVTAGHYLAAAAGFRVMQAGGSAVDAGVAAGISLNVVLFNMTSFGGVAPIILYHAETDSLVTLDGLGVWPRLADIDRLREGGEQGGILRSVTPGAPDSWLTALERFGTLTLGEVLEPAWELAMGAPVATTVAEDLKRREASLDEVDEATREIYFPGGRAPEPGDVMVQEDLAGVFRALMDEEAAARREGASREEAIRRARDLIYRGWIAEKMGDFHRENGGWMRYEDLASHRVEVAPPLGAMYRGYDVYTCGPWCQGPMLLEFLNLLDNFDLERLGHNSTEYLHVLIECMDLVFADRENFYGDPRKVEVPMGGLLSPEYGRERAALVDPERAHGQMPAPGNPWRHETGREDREVRPVDPTPYIAPDARVRSDTSYAAAADARGNVFSVTPSDPVFWTPVIPGLGFSCSGRGVQSRTDPDHPSCLAPGKRPRLTPNPALVMRGGRPLMGFGCPGGDAQTQGMLQVLLNLVHQGMSPQEAIEAPRVISRNYPNSFAPHAYYPGRVDVEGRIPGEVCQALAGMGHGVTEMAKWAPGASSVHIAMINPGNGVLIGGADPRREGEAIAW